MRPPLRFALITLLAATASAVSATSSARPARSTNNIVAPDNAGGVSASRAPQLVARLAGDSPHVAGQPLVLDVIVHNETNRDVNLGDVISQTALFRIEVAYRPHPGAAATPCKRTRYGDKLFTPMVGKPWKDVVKAGQKKLYHFPLGRLFDLSEAGIYSVVVVRPYAGHTEGTQYVHEEMRSGEVNFALIEP